MILRGEINFKIIWSFDDFMRKDILVTDWKI